MWCLEPMEPVLVRSSATLGLATLESKESEPLSVTLPQGLLQTRSQAPEHRPMPPSVAFP